MRERNGSSRAWRRKRAVVLAQHHYVCTYCGAPATHVDHRIPLARGGTDALDNLVASCRRCNLSKGTKTVPEFRQGGRKITRKGGHGHCPLSVSLPDAPKVSEDW